MKESILQYLINDISKSMLDTATIYNRGTREHCFKDLKASETIFSKITKSSKSNRWLVRLSSNIRSFDWEDSFAFNTRDVVDVLKPEAAAIKTEKDILVKTNVNGLFYIRDTHSLVYIVSSIDEIVIGRPIEFATSIIPNEMYVFDPLKKDLAVNHPYVKGHIKVIVRPKK